MSKKNVELPPLEQGLLRALQAIDTQVARELQRTPAERDLYGVQKWEPFQKRVERISAFVLECFGDQEIQLDSVIVMAQAMSQVLTMLIDELGLEGLGDIRAAYCTAACEGIDNACDKALRALRASREVN